MLNSEKILAMMKTGHGRNKDVKEMAQLVYGCHYDPDNPRQPNEHNFIIAVDFDGTIVEHKFPDIGKPVPGIWDNLKRIRDLKHVTMIMSTMRSGVYLEEAREFVEANGIVFDYYNINPHQFSWTTSHKIYSHILIDDTAIGCPLIWENHKRPYVDWSQVITKVFDRYYTWAHMTGKDLDECMPSS